MFLRLLTDWSYNRQTTNKQTTNCPNALKASGPKEQPMAQAAAILALSERLRKRSRKARNREAIADLRLATCYLRALAVLKIAEETEVAIDPARKPQLEQEATQLRVHAR
jgi:hypothetical protein